MKKFYICILYSKNFCILQVGDIVYCKFLVANKDMEPELVCIDGHGKSASLGIIGRDGGMVVQVPIDLIRK